LSSQTALAEEVSEALKDLTDDTVIVVLGPTGEGKSVALKQVGIDYASDPEVEVLQVETATATLSQEFIAELRSRDRPILLLIDEADLILDAVCASLRNADSAGNQILVVACMHSQFEHKVDYWKREIGVWRVVRFDGLDADSDAGALARYWQRHGLLPGSYNGANPDGVADLIQTASQGQGGRSLYGSMLELWDNEELLDRVNHTVQRLSRKKLPGANLADALKVIALVDLAWEEESSTRALTLPGLGAVCGVQSEDVLNIALRPLGREASIAQIGEMVIIRHPAIRDAIIDLMTEDELVRIGEVAGAAGGRLRLQRHSDHHVLTAMSRRLQGPVALKVAESAMKASHLLESRTTYLATCRDQGQRSVGLRYARGLAGHVNEFPDYVSSARGYYVEWSQHEAAAGYSDRALALCLFALSDEGGGRLSQNHVNFALSQLHKQARSLANPALRSEILRAVDGLNNVASFDAWPIGGPTSTTIRSRVFALRQATQIFFTALPIEGAFGFQQLMKLLSQGA
jgi:hypothetical protein